MSDDLRKWEQKIAKILIKRDGYDKEEALDIAQDTRKEIMEAARNGDIYLIDSIIQDNLSLEPDYGEELIFIIESDPELLETANNNPCL